ncbi:retrovirus-related pol polyprotein from transposon TNT 1-94 [Tanacetum coccineum]
MDVKTDFLNDPLKEEVYVNQSKKVYRLRKALYGLKQALRAWYDELSTFLISKGFTKVLQIHQSPRGSFINQAKYALEILKKHGMDKCDSIGTPMDTKPKLDADLSGTPIDQTRYQSMIESLMYLTSSRPDLVQAVCYCACYQARPMKKHLKEVKRIFRYLMGTINIRLLYPKDSVGCQRNKTAMSTIEAEYVALSASCAQVMRTRSQLKDYGFDYNKIPLYCDSQLAIAISCNPVRHSRTKHINVRYHFIKEHVERGISELYFVKTEYQLAGIFTKALWQDRFEYLVRRLGMRCLTLAKLECMTRSSNKDLIQPFNAPKQVFHLNLKLFDTSSLDYSSSSELDLFSEYKDQSEGEVTEIITEPTMEEYVTRSFPMSLTGAASHWLRNELAGLITTWETLKVKFLSKYCPPAKTAKKMEEINNFQQDPDETLYQAWEQFKELLLRCPQHYLMDMQKVISFYKGLDVPTRQILDSKGVIPSMKAADAKKALQDIANHSQK